MNRDSISRVWSVSPLPLVAVRIVTSGCAPVSIWWQDRHAPQASGGSGVGAASQFTACASTRAVSSLPICSSPWNSSAWAKRWLRNAAWRNRFGRSWPMIVSNGMGFDPGQAGPPRPQPGLHDLVDRARHDVFGGGAVYHANAARVLSGD